MVEPIDGSKSIVNMIFTVADNHPNSVQVLISSLRYGHLVDPESSYGPLAFLMLCDAYNIYGLDIWALYKEVCNKQYATAHALLLAVELGLINLEQLKTAMKRRGRGIDVDTIVSGVRKLKPSINLNPPSITTN